MKLQLDHTQVLFWLGILGILFYVTAPILFPSVPNLRQPELLPVYTLMVGLGQILRGNGPKKEDERNNKSDTEDS